MKNIGAINILLLRIGDCISKHWQKNSRTNLNKSKSRDSS